MLDKSYKHCMLRFYYFSSGQSTTSCKRQIDTDPNWESGSQANPVFMVVHNAFPTECRSPTAHGEINSAWHPTWGAALLYQLIPVQKALNFTAGIDEAQPYRFCSTWST